VTSPNAREQAAEGARQQAQAPVRRDPQVIEREIEQTRAELAKSIDAITSQLSPKRLANRGVQVVRDQFEAMWADPGARTGAIVATAAVVVLGGWALRRRRR
jgi:hypothetical protein